MLFNSVDFAIFLPIVFAAYWLLRKRLALQNTLILVSSYFFYGWWDWRFLILIVISTLVDYAVGLKIAQSANQRKRKSLLIISILINLGFLGFFKYYNFFVENFVAAYSLFGKSIDPFTLEIILPVGISFYTFQTLSYTIDVYRGKLEPSSKLIPFASFVCFFPQLVAGPIERATHLLPQFYKKREFNYLIAVDGLRQIIWGLFKKVVVADSCAEYVNLIFNSNAEYAGSTLALGAVLFAFQIYGDFSGYSDIAIGTSKLFGFDLMKNFSYPYFSRDIAEFWRRWHISLSTWFRDYLYIPLGGSRVSTNLKIRNTFIIFIVSGFWHGANWTFIVWGALNAIYFLPLLLTNKNRSNIHIVASGKLFPSAKEFLSILSTFMLTTFAWIFFRAENLPHAIDYVSVLFSTSIMDPLDIFPHISIFTILFLVAVEWLNRDSHYGLDFTSRKPPLVIRWSLYLILCFCISIFFGKENSFIYFQF